MIWNSWGGEPTLMGPYHCALAKSLMTTCEDGHGPRQREQRGHGLGLVQLEVSAATSRSQQLQRGADHVPRAAKRTGHHSNCPPSRERGWGRPANHRDQACRTAAAESVALRLTLPGAPRRSNTREDCSTAKAERARARLSACSQGSVRVPAWRGTGRRAVPAQKRSEVSFPLTDSLPVRRSVMLYPWRAIGTEVAAQAAPAPARARIAATPRMADVWSAPRKLQLHVRVQWHVLQSLAGPPAGVSSAARRAQQQGCIFSSALALHATLMAPGSTAGSLCRPVLPASWKRAAAPRPPRLLRQLPR